MDKLKSAIIFIPIALSLLSLAVAWGVQSAEIKELQTSKVVQEENVKENRKDISTLLTIQSVMNERTVNIQKDVEETKTSLKELLKEFRRQRD